MKKIRVKSYSDVCIGEYPFHKELKDELVPLLENYPDKQGRQTNVIVVLFSDLVIQGFDPGKTPTLNNAIWRRF